MGPLEYSVERSDVCTFNMDDDTFNINIDDEDCDDEKFNIDDEDCNDSWKLSPCICKIVKIGLRCAVFCFVALCFVLLWLCCVCVVFVLCFVVFCCVLLCLGAREYTVSVRAPELR
jgi:hypothetical protein